MLRDISPSYNKIFTFSGSEKNYATTGMKNINRAEKERNSTSNLKSFSQLQRDLLVHKPSHLS